MSLPICKFYSLNQTCRFGKNCRFSHSQRPPPFPNTVSLPEKENEASGVTSHIPRSVSSESFEPTLSPQNDSDLKRKLSERKSFEHQISFNTDEVQDDSSNKQPVCPYFARGWCRYGRSCRFSHVRPHRKTPKATNVGPSGHQEKYIPPRFQQMRKNSAFKASPKAEDVESKVKSSDELARNTISQNGNGKQQRQREKACSFFKSARCKKGVHCKFLHTDGTAASQVPNPAQMDVPTETAESSLEKEHTSGKSFAENTVKPVRNINLCQRNQRPFALRQVFTLSELEEVGSDEVRNGEIQAIKKRFPKDKIIHDDDGKNFQATIKFVPTDPDWPFDVKEFTIAVVIPPTYPKETLKVTLPVYQDIPDTVRRYIEVSIQEWILDRQEQLTQSGKVELLFRPFLRWLDRSIEEITTEALLQLKRELTAKAAGFEFIPAKQLQAKFASVSESSAGDSKEIEGSENGEESKDGTEDKDEEEDSSSEEEEVEGESTNQSLEIQPQQRGTEISLKYLQLKENAAALLFQRLKVILQCGRCKSHSDIYVTQGNVISVSCDRCNNDMLVTYRPGLLHQFSSVLGYLDVDGCQAFDLVLQDCRVSVSCMACNKQTTMDGLVSGQVINGWCKACNARFKLATEAVKLTQLAPSGVDTDAAPVIKSTSSKAKKPPKDPSIREGYPLPEFGTCKHYKHSYRWLRFPCCGKAYPCDVCHDKKEDHEMTFANRMICGHCCKEQNFSGSRPCSGCGEHMTKVHSAHWEGGSGCRDKISMSKGDTQKYKNMNKTVSNKKKLESGSKKKNTKLRHA